MNTQQLPAAHQVPEVLELLGLLLGKVVHANFRDLGAQQVREGVLQLLVATDVLVL